MEIKIRKAALKDVKNLFCLAKELQDFHNVLLRKNKNLLIFTKLKPDWKLIWEKWIIRHIKSKNSLVMVAESNSLIVGYFLVYIKDNIPIFSIKKLGHVSDLYVKRGYRGKGIASRFKKEAFKWFREKDLKYLSIMASSDNKKAHNIYKKWGFSDLSVELRCLL